MKSFVATLLFCLLATGPALAQAASDPCSSGADERAVHAALLAHFQVMEGSVKVAALERTVPSDGRIPSVAAAIADFNGRNAAACPGVDGPLGGLALLAGAHRTRLSRVGFDAAGTTAFAEITMIGGPEIGSGHYVVLTRQAKGWTVTEEHLYRMF